MRTLYAVSFPKFSSKVRDKRKPTFHVLKVRADSPDQARELALIQASAEGIFPKIYRTAVAE